MGEGEADFVGALDKDIGMRNVLYGIACVWESGGGIARILRWVGRFL